MSLLHSHSLGYRYRTRQLCYYLPQSHRRRRWPSPRPGTVRQGMKWYCLVPSWVCCRCCRRLLCRTASLRGGGCFIGIVFRINVEANMKQLLWWIFDSLLIFRGGFGIGNANWGLDGNWWGSPVGSSSSIVGRMPWAIRFSWRQIVTDLVEW